MDLPDRIRCQLVEAEWIAKEKLDCLRVIEQYRGLYVTAVFIALGWILGQSISHRSENTSVSNLMGEPEIAAIMLMIPFLGTLFVLLILDIYQHMLSLARYQFLLGCSLGDGTPVWRWELFKKTPEGSADRWVQALNLFVGVFSLIITACCLALPFWAIWTNGALGLKIFWAASAGVATVGVAVGIAAAYKTRFRNPVSSAAAVSWEGLWTAVESPSPNRPKQPRSEG